LTKCQFTTKYWNYESRSKVDYNCPDDEENLGSGRCIFHDENYLQDKSNRKENEQKVRDRLMTKVHNSIDKKEALLCIGYHLPHNIAIKGDFIKPVSFSQATMQCNEFSVGVDFSAAEFSGEARFLFI
jgi:hypothetical protein